MSARQAADQLGHADIGTTQKHYFGRQTVITEGAAVMEQIADADDPAPEGSSPT